jgi:hypothetical protein
MPKGRFVVKTGYSALSGNAKLRMRMICNFISSELADKTLQNESGLDRAKAIFVVGSN